MPVVRLVRDPLWDNEYVFVLVSDVKTRDTYNIAAVFSKAEQESSVSEKYTVCKNWNIWVFFSVYRNSVVFFLYFGVYLKFSTLVVGTNIHIDTFIQYIGRPGRIGMRITSQSC